MRYSVTLPGHRWLSLLQVVLDIVTNYSPVFAAYSEEWILKTWTNEMKSSLFVWLNSSAAFLCVKNSSAVSVDSFWSFFSLLRKKQKQNILLQTLP